MTSAYDLIVIGAGINGAAIAREAALAGLAVLVLDQSDIGGGTTSASTRLIHGGLRYLEHGELGLVRESLREREALLELAPHLVEPLGLYLPLYQSARRARWQVRIGLWLYDLLSLGKSLPEHRMLSRQEMRERMPGLEDRELIGGAFYFDAQITFPERLVVENVLDAARNGAAVMNHTRVTRVISEGGIVCGVCWRNRRGISGRATAPIVVNATGPWIDEVIGTIAGDAASAARGGSSPSSESASRAPLIGGTKGSHLVVETFPGAPRGAIYTEAASDGRPFFVLPWNGMYLIGTTDVRYDGDPGTAAISDAELDYLVTETDRLFPRSGGIARRVLYTQAGVRPLPYQPKTVEGAITRRHLIHAHSEARGLYSIIGGKLTTHRSLAQQVLERLRRDAGWKGNPAQRKLQPLPGAADDRARDVLVAQIAQRFGEEQAQRLWHTYGRRAERLLAASFERPELAAPAAPSESLLLRVELVNAIESEWAVSLIDILHRRCMLGLGSDFGLGCAPAAAEALRELGLWDRARAEEELHAYIAYAARSRARRLSESAPALVNE